MGDLTEQEKLARLRLSLTNGVGIATFKSIIDEFGSAYSFLTQDGSNFPTSLKNILQKSNRLDLEDKLRILEQNETKYIVYGEESYPFLLMQINDPPTCLFYKGDLQVLKKDVITIVGTRISSKYSEHILKNIIPDLIVGDFAIASGMAMGVDAIVHKNTINERGKTIAVLGSSVDNPTPKSNYILYDSILESGGVVLSEIFPSRNVFAGSFPRRNRILAGLSKAVIVTEAGRRSGALITAHLAFDYNREVFAFPGDINRDKSAGANLLIKLQKAKLIENAKDVFDELGLITREARYSNRKLLEGNQKIIYELLRAGGAISFDAILAETKLTAKALIAELTLLEIEEYIYKDIDLKYSAII